MQCPPLQRLQPGTKHYNNVGFWHGVYCTLGRLHTHVKVKTCVLQAVLTTKLRTSGQFPIENVSRAELQ